MDEELTPEESEAFEAMKADETPAEEPKAEEAKPEVTEKPAGEPEKEETPEFKSERAQTMVPHQAMHAERMKRQAAEAKLAELETRLSAIEKPPEEAPQWVDPLVDPEGHRKWTEYQTSQATSQVEEIKQARAREAAVAQRQVRAQNYETEFIKDNADFVDAANFAAQARLAELGQAGLNEQQAVQRLAQETTAVFNAAEAAGINPCALIYQRAAQVGYKKADPAADTATKAAEEAAKVTALAAAQAATKTATVASGGAEGGKLTAKQIAEMSDAEFDKLGEDELRRAMGG